MSPYLKNAEKQDFCNLMNSELYEVRQTKKALCDRERTLYNSDNTKPPVGNV